MDQCGLNSRSGGLNGCVKFLAQHLARWQYRKIFGDMDASSAEFQQFDLLGRLGILSKAGCSVP